MDSDKPPESFNGRDVLLDMKQKGRAPYEYTQNETLGAAMKARGIHSAEDADAYAVRTARVALAEHDRRQEERRRIAEQDELRRRRELKHR